MCVLFVNKEFKIHFNFSSTSHVGIPHESPPNCVGWRIRPSKLRATYLVIMINFLANKSVPVFRCEKIEQGVGKGRGEREWEESVESNRVTNGEWVLSDYWSSRRRYNRGHCLDLTES